MDSKTWKQLSQAMAVEVFCDDMAEMMVPRSVALERIERGAKQSQDWMNMEYRMGQALIALESLGYRIEPPKCT